MAAKRKPAADTAAAPAQDGRRPNAPATSPALPDPQAEMLRKAVDARLDGLERARWSRWQRWRLLSRYIRPQLGRFYPLPNSSMRGQPRNQHIINNCATEDLKDFAAGMAAGTCSPARPWFKLHVGGRRYSKAIEGAAAWGDEVAERMLHVFAESNFYPTIAASCMEEGLFGTSAGMIVEDYENVIQLFGGTAGEYYIGNDARLEAGVFGRKLVKTCREMVDEWGEDRVSESVRQCWKTNRRDEEFVVGHLVEPADSLTRGAFGMADKAWRQTYWEYGSAGNRVLEVKGFHDKPFWGSRWEAVGNDAYGYGPGDDAIGDVIQIQVEERRKAQALEMKVKPPMIADARLRNEPASMVPGGVTFVEPAAAGVGFKPAYEIQVNIAEIATDIAMAEKRVGRSYFTDIFFAISQLDTVRSAAEIYERRDEKMLQLGAPLDRQHGEKLGPIIKRTYAIMDRAGLLPPAPPALKALPIEIEFVSVLALAQRAASTAAIERTFAFAGNVAAAKADVLDNLDTDEALRRYGDSVNAPAAIFIPAAAVEKIRAARAKQAAQDKAVALSMAAVQGAKTMSETDVGGGLNAVSAMTGLGPAPAQGAA